MKTFKEEYNKLLNWYFEEITVLQQEQKPPINLCFDGKNAQKQMIVGAEFRKKAKELKEKYKTK